MLGEKGKVDRNSGWKHDNKLGILVNACDMRRVKKYGCVDAFKLIV